ncbi:MAG TPA: hypothetical protein VH640_31395 [Bryobacteraceae bacterium]|jgi:hypothetical protein
MRKPILALLLLAAAHLPVSAGVQYMVIGYGQSLSTGNWGCGLISVSQPYSNQMLSNNGTGTTLVPLTEQASQWQTNSCTGFVYAYSSGTSYLPGQVVMSGANAYKAITTVPAGNAPPNSTYWAQVSAFLESPVSSTANNLTYLAQQENSTSFTVISNGYGHGGYNIAELERGTAPYNALLTGVTNAKAAAVAAGNTLVVLGVVFTEGEADWSANSTTYYNDCLTLHANLLSDISAITSQNATAYPIPFFYSQTSQAMAESQAGNTPGPYFACPDGTDLCLDDSTGSNIASNGEGVVIAQWRLAHDFPNLFYLTGPKYQYTYYQGQDYHLDYAGYNYLGATTARILKCLYVDHAPNCVAGVYPKSIVMSAKQITVTVGTPTNAAYPNGIPLDTPGNSILPYPWRGNGSGSIDSNGMGFQVFQTVSGMQSAIPISSVTTSGQTITITLSQLPNAAATNLRLVYAFEGVHYGSGLVQGCSPDATACGMDTLITPEHGQLHGNIYTVPDYTSLAPSVTGGSGSSGVPVRHFMVHFNEQILPLGSATISGGACSGCRL